MASHVEDAGSTPVRSASAKPSTAGDQIMTNRQMQVGKFAPNRAEQPKFNKNWWLGLPDSHPLHDKTPTRQQRRATTRKLVKRRLG
jgi:hypothetical protein